MISPQGYSLGEDPKAKNPFWDGDGEDSNVNRIYATAEITGGTGTPSVQTSKTVSGHDITFGFSFNNLKGETGAQGERGLQGIQGERGPAGPAGPAGPVGATGEQGPKGDTGATGATGPAGPAGERGPAGETGPAGVSPTIDVVTITGGHRVDITDAQGTESFNVLDGQDGAPGTPGQSGQDGVTPDISMSATADATSSANPTVTVTKGGTTANPTFSLAFSGLKGETGATGATGAQGPAGPAGSTGPQGPAGQGVPAGGTAGQVLQKVDGTDYNTEWATPSGGGGGLELVNTYAQGTSLRSIIVDLREKCASGVLNDGDDIVIFGNLWFGIDSSYPIKISRINLSTSATLIQDSNAQFLEIPHIAKIEYNSWGGMTLTGCVYCKAYQSGNDRSARLWYYYSDSSDTTGHLAAYMNCYAANNAVEFITCSNTQTEATRSIAIGRCKVYYIGGISIYKVSK